MMNIYTNKLFMRSISNQKIVNTFAFLSKFHKLNTKSILSLNTKSFFINFAMSKNSINLNKKNSIR